MKKHKKKKPIIVEDGEYRVVSIMGGSMFDDVEIEAVMGCTKLILGMSGEAYEALDSYPSKVIVEGGRPRLML